MYRSGNAAVCPKLLTFNFYSVHFITCKYAHKSASWLFPFKVNKSFFFYGNVLFCPFIYTVHFSSQRMNSRRAEYNWSTFLTLKVDKWSSWWFLSWLCSMMCIHKAWYWEYISVTVDEIRDLDWGLHKTSLYSYEVQFHNGLTD